MVPKIQPAVAAMFNGVLIARQTRAADRHHTSWRGMVRGTYRSVRIAMIHPATPAASAVQRLGSWAAWSMVGIGCAYAVALGVGFVRYGLSAPITDPLLAIMEVLTLLSAPSILVLMAALREDTMPERRIFGTLSLGFAVAFATLTSSVHFVELTALRQLGRAELLWPSVAYAVELLAWDGFLGLALLSAAAAIPPVSASRSSRWDSALRRTLLLAGVLCVAGLAGPALGRMRWQFVGVFGYSVMLPVVCYLLARRFSDAPR